jgi:hypothetical protein
MSVSTIADIKNRFAAQDKPAAKDFTDMIDTLLSAAIAGAVAEAKTQIVIPTAGANVIYQSVAPNASHSGSIWMKTDATTGAIIRAYNFWGSGTGFDNMWHARHPVPPGTTIVVQDTSWNPIANFDGGGSPGMGAMWQLASVFTNKFIFGADTVNYPVGATGGEASHVLSLNESVAHSHFIANTDEGDLSNQIPLSSNNFMVTNTNGKGSSFDGYTLQGSGHQSFVGKTSPAGGTGTVAAPHNNMPPFIAAYFLQRTTRLDYIEAPGP